MPEVNYFWDEIEDNVVREYDENNNTIANYTTEPTLYGSVLTQDRGGEIRHYHFDGQGNTTELTDNAGNVTDSRRYSAFGIETQSTGNTVFAFRNKGQRGYYTTEPTLRYVRRRYLDSRRGIWLGADPLFPLSGINAYQYVGNRPTAFADPSGLVKYCESSLVPVLTIIREILQAYWAADFKSIQPYLMDDDFGTIYAIIKLEGLDCEDKCKRADKCCSILGWNKTVSGGTEATYKTINSSFTVALSIATLVDNIEKQCPIVAKDCKDDILTFVLEYTVTVTGSVLAGLPLDATVKDKRAYERPCNLGCTAIKFS